MEGEGDRVRKAPLNTDKHYQRVTQELAAAAAAAHATIFAAVRPWFHRQLPHFANYGRALHGNISSQLLSYSLVCSNHPKTS